MALVLSAHDSTRTAKWFNHFVNRRSQQPNLARSKCPESVEARRGTALACSTHVQHLQRLEVAVRSAAVGLLATAIDLLVLALLTTGGVSPRVASVPALVLGISAQFAGNKLLAFRDRTRQWVRQGAYFALVELGALGLNVALFDLAVERLNAPVLLVRLATTSLVYVAFSLPLWSHVFRARAETS